MNETVPAALLSIQSYGNTCHLHGEKLQTIDDTIFALISIIYANFMHARTNIDLIFYYTFHVLASHKFSNNYNINIR